CDSAGPDHCLRGDRVGSSGTFNPESVSIHVCDPRTGSNLDTKLSKESRGLFHQVLRETRQYSGRCIQQDNLGFLRLYGTEVVLERLPPYLTNRPSHFASRMPP